MKLLNIFMRTMKIMGNRCFHYLTAMFVMSVSFAMFSVMGSLLMKNVVDAAQTQDSRRILFITIGNVVIGIIALLTYRISAVKYNVEAKRAYGNLCKAMFDHEVHLPYSYYETHHSGDFMSKLSYDLEKTGSIYGSRLRRTLSPILQVIVFLIPMLIMSWQVTLGLIGVNLIMLLINFLLINPIKAVTKTLSKINVKMTENLSNLLQGMEQARMYRAGKTTVDEFMKENEHFAKENNKRILYIACLESSNRGFDLLCALAFLLLGIYFVNKGVTTLGSLTAIYTLYANFSIQFLQLGRYFPELIGCLSNAQNLFEFMKEDKEPNSWYEDKKVSGILQKNEIIEEVKVKSDFYIELENIKFNYREDKALLDGFSLDILKGESVAITGHSGCGKTTLSKLLLGLYPLKEGDICIGGSWYSTLSNEQIRTLFAYVPQEPYLFQCSVKENIQIANPSATEEEIVQAASMAHAHDFIVKLPKGYDTVVGERGNLLSGGERQRIAIARAIIKKAPILLLDEATSALDNESERLVNEALKSLQSSKTILMIAHRPSTIALANRVVEMGI